MKLHKFSIVILAVFTVSVNSCSKRSTIKLVSNSAPPTFDITGGGELDWIWFQGPYQNPHEPGPEIKKGSDPKEIILWKISPPGHRFIPMKEVTKIIYGQLPEGWEQDIPRDGSPPALLDGYVYYVGVVPARGGGTEMCVFLKDGQVQPFQQNEEDVVCGRKK
ncbi:MAG TPA: hypothetical protein VGD61_23805 [Pyrinomonadaceae bacterium]